MRSAKKLALDQTDLRQNTLPGQKLSSHPDHETQHSQTTIQLFSVLVEPKLLGVVDNVLTVLGCSGSLALLI